MIAPPGLTLAIYSLVLHHICLASFSLPISSACTYCLSPLFTSSSLAHSLPSSWLMCSILMHKTPIHSPRYHSRLCLPILPCHMGLVASGSLSLLGLGTLYLTLYLLDLSLTSSYLSVCHSAIKTPLI
jgi:hypothetical protein